MYLAFDTGLQYLTFTGRNLENKKTLIQIQLMNRANINNKKIVNICGILVIVLLWTLFIVDNTRMNNVLWTVAEMNSISS